MELEALPGIGMVLADRIVAYRSTHGGFQYVGDLMNVSGIGEIRLRRLEPFVTVETIVREIGKLIQRIYRYESHYGLVRT